MTPDWRSAPLVEEVAAHKCGRWLHRVDGDHAPQIVRLLVATGAVWVAESGSRTRIDASAFASDQWMPVNCAGALVPWPGSPPHAEPLADLLADVQRLENEALADAEREGGPERVADRLAGLAQAAAFRAVRALIEAAIARGGA